MVFADVSGPKYIKRTRVFVNSNERIANESKDGWTFAYGLPEELRNVCSVELVQYNVPRDAGPTFKGTYSFEQLQYGDPTKRGLDSNTTTPWFVSYPDEAGQPSFYITGDLDPAISFSGSAIIAPQSNYIIPADLLFSVVAADYSVRAFISGLIPVLPDPYNYILDDYPGQEDKTSFSLETNTIPIRYANVELQYKSRGYRNITAIPMGFNPNRDAVMVNNVLTADYTKVERPYRYLDIFVDEASELLPVARVPVVNEIDSFATSPDPASKPRILLNPIPRLEKMHIRIRLADNVLPPLIADTGSDLIFDVYSISEIQQVPDWITNYFYL